MAIFVMECPACRRLVEADDVHLHESAVCPYCQQTLEIRHPPRVKPFCKDGTFPPQEPPEGNVAPGVWIVR